MNAYGYEKQIINTLNKINNNSNNFYNYKDLNFLSKLRFNNRNIVIIFHGAVSGSGTDRVVFRGFDWVIENTDIICISDFMLNKYKEYTVNWALSTRKFNATDIYRELFLKLFSIKKYKNIIFTGSSAGGFPSIKFSCEFNAIAIITNSQLYLENSSLFKIGRSKRCNGIYSIMDIKKFD